MLDDLFFSFSKQLSFHSPVLQTILSLILTIFPPHLADDDDSSSIDPPPPSSTIPPTTSNGSLDHPDQIIR